MSDKSATVLDRPHHLVFQNVEGRQIHVPGFSGFGISGHIYDNLMNAHAIGHASVKLRKAGKKNKLVIRLPKNAPVRKVDPATIPSSDSKS